MADQATTPPIILWLRRDLRLGDNPALLAAMRLASERGATLLPVYVWESRSRRAWAPGGAARWWLWRSLASLDDDLRRLGSRLLVERGDPVGVARRARATGRGAGAWSGRPDSTPTRSPTTASCSRLGRSRHRGGRRPAGDLLADPLATRTQDGRPYSVFTPFWRARLAAGAPDKPLPAPAALPPAPDSPPGLSLAALEAEAAPPWSAGFSEVWRPGERGAHARLESFLEGPWRTTRPTATGPTSTAVRASRHTCTGAS